MVVLSLVVMALRADAVSNALMAFRAKAKAAGRVRTRAEAVAHAHSMRARARASTVLDSRADAEADVEWESLPQPGGGFPDWALDANTDGQMHWYRQWWHGRLAFQSPGVNSLMGNLIIGEPGIGAGLNGGVGNQNRNGFDTNPQVQPPLTNGVISLHFRLTPADILFITAHAVQMAVGNLPLAVGAPVPLWPPPQNPAKYNGCHPSIVQALIVRGAGGGVTNRDKADAGFAATFGPIAACTLNVPLADVHTYIAAMGAIAGVPPLTMTALTNHYVRFRQLLGADYDITELRGWLYATDRAHGHRLVGATGFASNLHRGADHNQEGGYLLKRDSNNVRNYGLPADTVGHVRPQAMGGERDPINFVPQSEVGQKMVNAAETLAMQFAEHCGNDRARYTVIYGYDAMVALARRPESARTVVDVTGATCTMPNFGMVPLVAGQIFNEQFPTF
jgi:hypothetical protein